VEAIDRKPIHPHIWKLIIFLKNIIMSAGDAVEKGGVSNDL
jgi:hypothetical protein